MRILLTLVLLAVASMTPARAETSDLQCEVALYWDIEFEGDALMTIRNHENLARLGAWNDQISSIYITSGIWEFFEHANYTGASLRLSPGGHNLDRAWNDRISSFRCVKPTAPLQ